VRATLYTYLFDKKMMINWENKNGLKGQYNLAQGKRSVALGWRTGIKIVRATTFFERFSLFRTQRHKSQFRPKEIFCPDYCICTDGIPFIPFTPGVAMGLGYSGLSGRNLCIKSSSRERGEKPPQDGLG
jgi:hypothetical protein